jgi:hypothetical protein
MFTGPNIVEEGLVFTLDAGNTKCYPGSGTDLTDISTQAFDATLQNGTSINSSYGGVFEFDGTNDYITTGNTFLSVIPIGTSTEYTLEAWIYVHTSSGTTTTADSIVGHTSATGFGMQVGQANGNPKINYGARSTSNFYSSEFSYNTWTHVVFSRRSTNPECFTYLNGALDVSSSNNLDVLSPSDGDVQIGYSGPRITGYYDGLMGPIKIYNRALTASEVLQNYNATKGRFL